MVGSGLQYITLFGLLAYLTRILSPRDFGLMATIAIGLDLGIRLARWGQIELLQQPGNRNDAARNHAFRLSMMNAVGVAALFVVAAWPVSQLFQSPQLVTMSLLCAPVVLLSAANATPEAILRNEYRFHQLAYRNMASTLIGGGVAVFLARHGYGAIALAAQQLVQAIIASLWVWSAVSWRPSLARTSKRSDELASQGASIMVGSMLPQLVPRSFDLLVGLLMGPIQLGILRVAYRFNDFIGQMVWVPLNGVASAQLGEVADDPPAMRWSYLQLTQVSAGLTCPVIVGIGLVAPEAVPILFGDTWSPSIPIVQVSALLGFVMPINFYFAQAMIARGKRRVVIRQGLVDVVVGVVLATIGANISLVAVAIASVVRSAITGVCNTVDLRIHLDLPLRDIARTLAPPYLASVVMTVAVLLTRMGLSNAPGHAAMLAILSLVGAAAYIATIAIGARLRLWPDYRTAFERLLPRVLDRF